MTDDIETQIENFRKQIDAIDATIITKLNERSKIVLQIKELKTQSHLPIFDPKREEEILTRITSVNKGPLYDDALKEIYEKILHTMKDLENR